MAFLGAAAAAAVQAEAAASALAPSPLSIKFESLARLSKNGLLQGAPSYRAGIPYSEIFLSYRPSDKARIRFGMDFHYRGKWRFEMAELSAVYSPPLPLSFQSLELQAGFFEYPLFYSGKNKKKFSKKTLLRQALPFSKNEDMGLSLKWNLYKKAAALQAAGFFSQTKLAPYKELRADRRPLLIMSLSADTRFGHVFAGGFRRQRARGLPAGSSRGFGFGGDLFYDFSKILKIKRLSFSLQGEALGVRRAAPVEISLSAYVFPRLKWRSFGLGFLWGAKRSYHLANHLANHQANHQAKPDPAGFNPKPPPPSASTGSLTSRLKAGQLPRLAAAAPASEQLIQMTWDMTENITLLWEKFIEEDSILRQKSWSLSLKTGFSL